MSKTRFDHISPTFCHLPFSTVFLATLGFPNPCCYSQFANDGHAKRIPEQSLSEYWNSDSLNNLRKQLINGEKPKSCWHCWVDEDNGMESKRMRDSSQYIGEHIENIIDTPLLLYIENNYGNLCNLGCRMCSPYASSIIEEESKKHSNEFTNETLHLDIVNPLDIILKEKDWYKDEKYIKDLKDMIPTARGLNVTGGEPTVNKHFQDLLDYCIETNVAKNIHLTFTTNGQQINKQYMDKINQFKRVHMILSIDGLNHIYEYIRYKASFKTLVKNIKMFKEYESDRFEIQVLNIYSFADLLKWHCDNEIQWSILNAVHMPKYHDIKCLPTESRLVARHKLTNFLNNYDLTKEQTDNVKSVISHTEIEDNDFQQKYYPVFIEHMKTLDKIRNTKLELIIPTLI